MLIGRESGNFKIFECDGLAFPNVKATYCTSRGRMPYLLSAIPQFLEPFRTRSARSTGTCRGPPSRPTSRKYARWRPSLPGRPFSMADRPSANRVPLAEIHLRCTSAKEFRRKKLMRIKKGTRSLALARARGNEGERRLVSRSRTPWAPREKSDLYISEKCIRITHPALRPTLISGTYRFISRVIDSALRYLQTAENAAVNIHNSNRSARYL